MDVGGRRDFWAAIRQDATRGRTVLFATHYLEEADAYADRIVLVRQGRIVADGTAAEVKALAAGRTVRATVPGVTAAAARGGPRGRLRRGARRHRLVHSKDSDAVARYLLTQTAARDLEIESRDIEDAFLALTADDCAPTTDTDCGDRHDQRRQRRRSGRPRGAPVPPFGGLNPTLLRIELRRCSATAAR